MIPVTQLSSVSGQVADALAHFTRWLDAYGELSWDHQSYFAGTVGRRAKGLYYKNKWLGTAAVAPMIFSEAFLPAGRRLFHHPIRFPIADAHYAMGFAFLFEATCDPAHLQRAVHFLDALKDSRSPGFTEYCWGYPFDWVTRNGVLKANTPFITTTPYVFEAFLQVLRSVTSDLRPLTSELPASPSDLRPPSSSAPTSALRPPPSALRPPSSVLRPPSSDLRPPSSDLCPPSSDLRPLTSVLCPLTSDLGPLTSGFSAILSSIVRHATTDIKEQPFSGGGTTCSYMPAGEFNVVNAAAYRATLLVAAAKFFNRDDWLKIAQGNVDFVLAAQNADGSWPYARDGVRDFVDHFHTCFVMKALAKIYLATGDQKFFAALQKGVEYYQKNLFGEDGMPRPFSKAPRFTVYKCELYDCAESINLCLLLRKDFPQLEQTLNTVVAGILKNWIKPDGSFRSRKLIFGWDNVPMHRWAQSQMFRSLAFYLREASMSKDGIKRSEVGAQMSEGMPCK